jgi:hypothetical protein
MLRQLTEFGVRTIDCLRDIITDSMTYFYKHHTIIDPSAAGDVECPKRCMSWKGLIFIEVATDRDVRSLVSRNPLLEHGRANAHEGARPHVSVF